MKSLKYYITPGLLLGSRIPVIDNSGASMIKLTGVRNKKGVRGRVLAAGVGDMVLGSVIKGNLDVRKTVVYAVIVRQRKAYKRPDGIRVSFEENAAVVLKDIKGQPKGTQIKGVIAKEAAERYPDIAKAAKIIV